MITVPVLPFKVCNDRVFPLIVSGNVKPGAFLPNGVITEGVRAIINE
jgi:hypothetical protein